VPARVSPPPALDLASLPAPFARAVASARVASVRPEVRLQEVPGPQRLAPYSFAMTADLADDGGAAAEGRWVVLFNPAGEQAWGGCVRIVSYVRAAVDSEMAEDPLLAAVGWSWLLEALDDRGAQHTAAAGTVTRTASARFGTLADGAAGADEAAAADIEVRASWSPIGADLGAHVSAWCDVLCAAAGLPPPGVAAMSVRRSH